MFFYASLFGQSANTCHKIYIFFHKERKWQLQNFRKTFWIFLKSTIYLLRISTRDLMWKKSTWSKTKINMRNLRKGCQLFMKRDNTPYNMGPIFKKNFRKKIMEILTQTVNCLSRSSSMFIFFGYFVFYCS